MKKKSKVLNVLLWVISAILVCVLLFSAYQIYSIFAMYNAESEAHADLMQYKPSDGDIPETSTNPNSSEHIDKTPGTPADNTSLDPLIAKNRDVKGWITVDNTYIDYPFVQADNNEHYLHTDVDKNYIESGALFLDCNSKSDFSVFNTIMYGHNMKNGSMFGSLPWFNNKNFFDENTTGKLFLRNRTFEIEIFACLVVQEDDKNIYCYPTSQKSVDEFAKYVSKNAAFYRKTDLKITDSIVTLSTCSYEFDEARTVVIGKLI
ncbi:MAG: class B sortase [Oscillospiraceae bacterium]|jgi:sortase B|nr:class B sortase [Oscillospiraceae bacterium]